MSGGQRERYVALLALVALLLVCWTAVGLLEMRP
jgi:hypothetical protein